MGAWVGAALTGLSALSGLVNKPKTTSEVNNTTTSTPTYDPTNLAFRDKLIGLYGNLINGSGDYQRAYTTQGLNTINRTSGIASNALSDLMTSRGLGRTSAGVNTMGMGAINNANQIASFLNNVPLIMDERYRNILGGATGYQASLPVGQTQHQQGTVTNQSTNPQGGILGGAASGLAAYLGQLSAQNSFTNALKSLGSSGPVMNSYPGIPGAYNYNPYAMYEGG